MKFNFRKYYNRLTLIILMGIVIVSGLTVNIIAFINDDIQTHLLSTIICIISIIVIIHLMNKEDKRLREQSIIITETLNTVLPKLDNYLNENTPATLYVSYKLYSALYVSEIGTSSIYSWFDGNTQMVTDTLIIIDSEMEGYSFGIEPRSKYINSIEDLYETKD